MFGRKWLTLPAGLVWAKTRNLDLTEKVLTDPEAFKDIALGIEVRLAAEEVKGQSVPTYFDHVRDAWSAIRALIADEKLSAEGKSVERRGLRSAIETHYPNAPIPSGEAGNLVMLDNWGGFTETVLGPDETYRFHNGQGRYWKRVRLSVADLLAAFPQPANEKSGDILEAEQHKLDAFDRPYWSLAMALGWVASWVAIPAKSEDEAKAIVRQLSHPASNTIDVCRHVLHRNDHPNDAIEHLTAVASERNLIATGVPFASLTEIREEIPYTCWQASRILPTTHGMGRKVLALFAATTPLYRDILLPAANVQSIWPIGEPRNAGQAALANNAARQPRKGDSCKIEAAARAVYPEGIPDALSLPDIIKKIAAYLKQIGAKVPHSRTIGTHIERIRRS